MLTVDESELPAKRSSDIGKETEPVSEDKE